jgi:hypothetical protein
VRLCVEPFIGHTNRFGYDHHLKLRPPLAGQTRPAAAQSSRRMDRIEHVLSIVQSQSLIASRYGFHPPLRIPRSASKRELKAAHVFPRFRSVFRLSVHQCGGPLLRRILHHSGVVD